MNWVKTDEDTPDQGVTVLIKLGENNGLITGWIEADGEWCVGNMDVSWDYLMAFNSGLFVDSWSYIED